jgi:AraC family transcriptional regulator, transcriptional activator of pobA
MSDIRFPSTKTSTQFAVFERKEFAGYRAPRQRWDFYKISLVLGSGRYIYAEKGIEVHDPALVFSNPLVPYIWEATSKKQEGYFCLFIEDFFKKDRDFVLQDTPLFKIGVNPVYQLNKEQKDYLASIFQHMLREFKSDYVHKNDLLRNHVNLVLHEAMKMQPSESYFKHNDASERIAALFLQLLERQFPIDSPQYALQLKTANDYAEHLSVHVNHLNRAVKKVTGKTTTAHISEHIISEAKALLKHTSWTINEIAYSLGFDYPTYFNNFFKKQTDTTPTAYRLV